MPSVRATVVIEVSQRRCDMNNKDPYCESAEHLINMTLDQIGDDIANSDTLIRLRQHPSYQSLVDLGETTIRVLFMRLREKRDHTTLLLLRDLLGVSGKNHPSVFENERLCDAYIQHGIKLGYIQ